MRTFIIALLIVCFLLVGYLLLGIFWIIGRFAPKSADLAQLRIIQFILKCITFLSGAKVTYIGKDQVPTEEPVLYIANHRSMFDIVVTYSQCPGLTGFISKDSIRKVPGLRAWMKRLHCKFLNRDDIKQGMKVILSAIDEIKSGTSIFIFPEGTRNRDKEDLTSVQPFKAGSFKIAQKTGCKIVPVAITGTNRLFEDHFPWVHKSNVIVEYGQPITFSELSPEDQKRIGTYFQEEIASMLQKHQL